MTDFSSLAGKFRVQKNVGNDSTPTRVIKRPRESLACNQCRRSKLKCDRGRPCGSCLKRNEAVINCTYNRPSDSDSDKNRNAVAEDRLSHLESVIKEMMQKQEKNDPPQSFTYSQPTPPDDRSELQLNNANHSAVEQLSSTEYVGSTHWSAILDDIHELRTALAGSPNGQEIIEEDIVSDPPLGDEVIFGSTNGLTVHQILDQFLPPRVEVDRLVATYFRGETFIIPFVHAIHFQKQYQEFWDDTKIVTPLWLSILFSICCMSSMMVKAETPTPASLNDESAILHMAAGHCLVLGDYDKPKKDSLVALALYGFCKMYRSLDPSRQASAIIARVVRMAYELGYHRDPDYFGTFSVFEGEMRRRFWAVCKQVDLMISFQLGLPSIVRLENCDTKSPRNLQDVDFDVNTKVLPQSRSEDEATKILWFIVKDRLMPNFAKVCQNALSFQEKSASEITQLDKEIRETYNSIPNVLRIRPVAESITDSAFLVMTRAYIHYIYTKSLCVLHRKYLARGNTFSTYCGVEAAISLVSTFLDIYQETIPGGQLHSARWMVNNFTLNDFHLGTMVLCLFVHTWRKKKSSPTQQNGNHQERVDDVNNGKEDEVLKLLERIYAVCIEKSAVSRDAWRVSHAVRLTLNSAKNSRNGVSDQLQQQNKSIAGSQPLPPDVDATYTASSEVSGSGFNPNSYQFDENIFGPLDPFNFIGGETDSIDWDMFDAQFLV